MGDLFGGGQKIVEYRYFANFAVAFEGPAGGVLRIWAGDRLIADLRQGAGAYANHPKYRFRIYLGSEDQESDRLIRQHVENSNDFDGHDATPAFRGLVYIVFDNLPLAFGNRIPPITAEIAWAGAPQAVVKDTTFLPGAAWFTGSAVLDPERGFLYFKTSAGAAQRYIRLAQTHRTARTWQLNAGAAAMRTRYGPGVSIPTDNGAEIEALAGSTPNFAAWEQNEPYTIALLIKGRSGGASTKHLYRSGTSSTGDHILFLTSGTTPNLRHQASGGGTVTVTSSVAIVNDTTWSAIVGTWRPGRLELYVDGWSRASSTAAATNTSALFGIYRWGWGFSTSQDFNGDIALIACFASSWTPAMVRRWHADPFGFLRPWNELPALIGSAPPVTPPSTGTGVVTFLMG